MVILKNFLNLEKYKDSMRPLIEELRKAFVEANEMGREYKRLSENELAKCVFCDIIAHK